MVGRVPGRSPSPNLLKLVVADAGWLQALDGKANAVRADLRRLRHRFGDSGAGLAQALPLRPAHLQHLSLGKRQWPAVITAR